MNSIAPESKKRAGDFSLWMKTAETLEKYKLVVWAIVFILLAIGFDYKTPAQSFREIRATQATQKSQIDTLFSRDGEQTTLMKGADKKIDQLIQFQCLSASQRERITLNCGDPR